MQQLDPDCINLVLSYLELKECVQFLSIGKCFYELKDDNTLWKYQYANYLKKRMELLSKRPKAILKIQSQYKAHLESPTLHKRPSDPLFLHVLQKEHFGRRVKQLKIDQYNDLVQKESVVEDKWRKLVEWIDKELDTPELQRFVLQRYLSEHVIHSMINSISMVRDNRNNHSIRKFIHQILIPLLSDKYYYPLDILQIIPVAFHIGDETIDSLLEILHSGNLKTVRNFKYRSEMFKFCYDNVFFLINYGKSEKLDKMLEFLVKYFPPVVLESKKKYPNIEGSDEKILITYLIPPTTPLDTNTRTAFHTYLSKKQ